MKKCTPTKMVNHRKIKTVTYCTYVSTGEFVFCSRPDGCLIYEGLQRAEPVGTHVHWIRFAWPWVILLAKLRSRELLIMHFIWVMKQCVTYDGFRCHSKTLFCIHLATRAASNITTFTTKPVSYYIRTPTNRLSVANKFSNTLFSYLW